MVAFWRACSPVLADAVPHYMAPCWYTLDPASRLITSHFQEGLPSSRRSGRPRSTPTTTSTTSPTSPVRRRASRPCTRPPAATRAAARGGTPTCTYGGDQEMSSPLRTRSGEVWGALGLYREPDRPLFDAASWRSCRRVGPSLADGVRRALLVGEAADPEGPEAPGLIVLGEDWRRSRSRPASSAGSTNCPTATGGSGRLPPAVLAVAGRARAERRARRARRGRRARVLTRSGRWVVLHGVATRRGRPAASGGHRRARHPARISPLLMSAYGLTEREQEVTRLVLQGYSTTEIAERLVISAHTVQQHLQERLRQDRRTQSARSGRRSVLRPLRAAAARQRASASPPIGRSAGDRLPTKAEALSSRTMSLPSGIREIGISLKLAMPNGIPMIVTQSSSPVTMWVRASHQPAAMIQITLPRKEKTPAWAC